MHCKPSVKLYGEGNISMCFMCLSMCLFQEQTKRLENLKKKECLQDCSQEEVLRQSPYSVQIQKNNDHKKLCIWTLFTQ